LRNIPPTSQDTAGGLQLGYSHSLLYYF